MPLNVPEQFGGSRPGELSSCDSASGTPGERNVNTESGDSMSSSAAPSPFVASGTGRSAVHGSGEQSYSSGDDSSGNDECEKSSIKTDDCPKTNGPNALIGFTRPT